jgi:hypothetical protein
MDVSGRAFANALKQTLEPGPKCDVEGARPLAKSDAQGKTMKIFTSLLLIITALSSFAVAQIKKENVEVGVQTTSLNLAYPDFSFYESQWGIGGRVTYNFNLSIAAEAEINFFPHKQFVLTADGSAIQAQFGPKIGKRFEKFGIFGKVRPGFLSVNRVGSFVPRPAGPNNELDFKIERETFFTLDAGGVLELYPSKRTLVRFEGGDTLVRHPARYGQSVLLGPVELIRPTKFKHNFQFSAGVGFRLGDFSDDQSSGNAAGDEGTRRYEIGVQFSSLLVTPGSLPSFTLPRKHSEPGFGGRFTFNLTEYLALEAEGDYFTREQFTFPQGGHMLQGQFGAKLGRRFEKWGLFGKARPGFVGFSRVFELPGVLPLVTNFNTKLYPSLDVGGVVEFYVCPRWIARFDIGDTMIHYNEISIPLSLPPFPFQRSETRHNLQVSTGIAFRF